MQPDLSIYLSSGKCPCHVKAKERKRKLIRTKRGRTVPQFTPDEHESHWKMLFWTETSEKKKKRNQIQSLGC